MPVFPINMFSWKQDHPLVVLSPMAGYTDSAMKQIVRMLCPEAAVVTEFVSADAVYYGSEKTLRMMAFDSSEHPVILQMFGKRPDRFVHAAKIAEAMGYDGIDINMGCPAKKVIHSDHGSALVKIENRCTAMQIVSDMTKAVKIPISVKTRLGWENHEDLVSFCKELEQNGCQSICIHGRTTKQGYRGEANWDPIYEVKRQLKIPVFGNGDITSVSAFRKKLGNLDGVFVARAAIGDPWIIQDIVNFSKMCHSDRLLCHLDRVEEFQERGQVERSRISHYSSLPKTRFRNVSSSNTTLESVEMTGDEELDHLFPRVENIPWEKKKPVVLKHLELSIKNKGEPWGVLEMRKHLAAYIKGMEGAKEMREKLMRMENKNDLEKIISSS